jgi:HSP20 family molecular chaperone IbpA
MTRLLHPFELDPLDLLWKDLFETNAHFSAITQKVTHPLDIYETEDGIQFEIAAVGLDESDIEILIESDLLRIRYDKQSKSDQVPIYRGIKKGSFDLTWKISPKFNLDQLKANLDKGLLKLNIPISEGKAVRKVQIGSSKKSVGMNA